MSAILNSGTVEPDYYIRRANAVGFSYPYAVTPRPGECLEDLLIRAACENGHNPAMSYRLLGIHERNIALAAPGANRFGIYVGALTALLGNPGGTEELEPLLHNDAPNRAAQRPFFDTWIDSNHFVRTRRVSPLALRKSPYLRAVWRLWPLAFDPETKEMLLQNCPTCEKPLSALFMGDVWCCDRCSEIDRTGRLRAVDLREHPQSLVDRSLWEDLDFATSFIDPTSRDTRVGSRARLHSDFENVSDGGIFDIICALSRSTMSRSEMNRKIMPPSLLASAAKIVVGWPESLEAAIAKGGYYETKVHPFTHLAHNKRLDERVRQRVKELGRLPRAMAKVNRTSGRQTRNLTADILRLQPEIRHFVTRVGTSVPTLMDMFDDHLLPEKLLRTFVGSNFNLRAERFLTELRSRASLSAKPFGTVPISTAVAALYARIGDPWPNVFKALLSGELQFWMSANGRRAFVEQISIFDMVAFAEIIARTENSVDPGYQIELTATEARSWTRLWDRFEPAMHLGCISRPFTRTSMGEFRRTFDSSNHFKLRLQYGKGRRILDMRAHLEDSGIVPVLECKNGVALWYKPEVECHFGSDLLPCVIREGSVI